MRLKVESGNGNSTLVFTATIADDATKVTYEENGTTHALKSSWVVGDKILGFDGDGNTYGYEVKSVDADVATFGIITTGDFAGSKTTDPEEGTDLYMIYAPGKKPGSISDKSLTVSLALQEEDIVPAVMMASGTIEGGAIDLSFKHQTAIIAIKNPTMFKSEHRYSSISMTGSNVNTEVVISLDGDSALQADYQTAGSIVKFVDFTSLTSKKAPTGDEIIYIAACPVSTSTDLTFRANHYEVFEKSGKTIESGNYYYMNEPAFIDTRPAGSYGMASVLTTAGRSDCEWVQLWEGGTKFASFNVGATISDYAKLVKVSDDVDYYTSGGVQTAWDSKNYTENCGGLYAQRNSTRNARKDPWGTGHFDDWSPTHTEDIANALWGTDWRTATSSEFTELVSGLGTKVTMTWVTGTGSSVFVDGCPIPGMKICGVGDYCNNMIFIPSAGYFYGDNQAYIAKIGEKTRFWTNESGSNAAFTFETTASNSALTGQSDTFGLYIRAVYDPNTAPLAGEFTVGPTTTDKVRFSKGNLYAKNEGTAGSPAWNWHFYDEQYKYNSLSTSSSRTANANDTEIDLFTWGYNAEKSIIPNGITSDNVSVSDGNNLSQEQDWGSQIGDGSTWRTLTTEEWQYLFETRTDASNKVGFATVGGVEGIIILPDTFTDPMKNNGSAAFVPKSTTEWTANVYTIGGNWEAMETAGAVFLPAAGSRYGLDVEYVGVSGIYWSSTAIDETYAYCVCFDSSDVIPVYDENYRDCGFSVRLITESK